GPAHMEPVLVPRHQCPGGRDDPEGDEEELAAPQHVPNQQPDQHHRRRLQPRGAPEMKKHKTILALALVAAPGGSAAPKNSADHSSSGSESGSAGQSGAAGLGGAAGSSGAGIGGLGQGGNTTGTGGVPMICKVTDDDAQNAPTCTQKAPADSFAPSVQ